MIGKRTQSAIILAVLAALPILGVVFFSPIIRVMVFFRERFNLPVCALNDMFDIRCPLCGGTRCCAALMHGNIAEALYYNPFLIIFGICFVIWYIRAAIRIIRGTAESISPGPVAVRAALAAVVLFMILRNTQFYRIFFY